MTDKKPMRESCGIPVRPEIPQDTMEYGSGRWKPGKLPKGGFQAVQAFNRNDSRNSGTTNAAAPGVDKLWNSRLHRQRQDY